MPAPLINTVGCATGTRVGAGHVVAGYDLPMKRPDGIDTDELLALFARDKKAVDGVTFVLDGPRGVEPVRVDKQGLLADTLEAIR